MRRFLLLTCLMIGFWGLQVLVNCSNPYDFEDESELQPENPLVILDTIVTTDTIFITDTTYIVDTIQTIDTTFIVDSFYTNDSIFIYDSTFIVDTIYNTDTLFVIDSSTVDTVILADTIVYTDTVVVYDTGTYVDTVEVIVYDTSQTQTVCARLSAALKDIVWMLRNAEGRYKLEFSWISSAENPKRNLIVTVDGVEYIWDPFTTHEMILEQYLDRHTTILIVAEKPLAHGREMDICLTISPL